MKLRELENKIGAQYQSVAAVIPASIERFAHAPGETLEGLAPEARNVSRALAVVIGARLVTRLFEAVRPRRHRAARVVFGRRRSRRLTGFRSVRLDDTAGAAPVAAFLLAELDTLIAKRAAVGRLGRALLISSFAFVLDQMILARRQRRRFEARGKRRLTSAIMCSAIGAAYAMTTPKEAAPPKDPSGGDIAAGVPAMGLP